MASEAGSLVQQSCEMSEERWQSVIRVNLSGIAAFVCLYDCHFSYWMFGTPNIRVMLLQPRSRFVLWMSDLKQCSYDGPKDGRCRVQLPEIQEPVHVRCR